MDRTDGIGAPDGLSGPEHADARTAIVSALTGESVADIEAAPNFKFRTSVPQMERLLYDAAGIPAGKTLGDRRTPFIDWLDQRESGGALASTELSSRADALDREMARKLQEADGGDVMSAAANQEPIKNETRANAGFAAESAPADQEATKTAEFAPDGNGLSQSAKRLRESSKGKPSSDTDVGLNTVGGVKYVSFVDAVAATRRAIESGIRPVPFQIHDALDILIGDAQRVIDAAVGSASAVESQSQPKNEAARPAATTPAVGNAPSPLEALFSDLNSDSTRKANKAKKAAAKLPEAARIEYVQANFHDILMQMMEAGALEVNGFATLTEENAPCL